MKIAVNTDEIVLLNAFNNYAKEHNHTIVNVKVQSMLFETIENDKDIDVYVLDNYQPYFKKAVDFIKKTSYYTPVIAFYYQTSLITAAADMYVCIGTDKEKETPLYDDFVTSIMYNISTYIKTFETLKKLTTKMSDKIEFTNCMYDPTRRLLYHKGKEVKKLSAKEGGILEVLASNYGNVVKKDVILEKVWHGTDYFKGRSMDVYITYLRNTLKNNKIKLTIKNISGIGLILE